MGTSDLTTSFLFILKYINIPFIWVEGMKIAYIQVSVDALFYVQREVTLPCFYPGENQRTHLASIYLTSTHFCSSSLFSLTSFQSCIIDLSCCSSCGGVWWTSWHSYWIFCIGKFKSGNMSLQHVIEIVGLDLQIGRDLFKTKNSKSITSLICSKQQK